MTIRFIIAAALHGASFTSAMKRLASAARKLLDPPRKRCLQRTALLENHRIKTA